MTSPAPLIALLEVESRLLRAGTRQEAAFIAVNELNALIPYRQAALWTGRGQIEAVSGLALPDENAPFTLWLREVFAALARSSDSGARPLAEEDLPTGLASSWRDWFPAHALLLRWSGGALLLVREEAWSEADRLLLERFGEALAAVWRGFDRPPRLGTLAAGIRLTRNGGSLLGLAVLAILAVPLRTSVLAPAEIVPSNPAIIRAPLDGVVSRLMVTPNQRIHSGQPLFELDSTDITGKLDIARQEYETAAAEYRQANQAQLFDPKAKAQVAILNARQAEKAAEVSWLMAQLARIKVNSPLAGIAVLDDPTEWIGRPVVVGEKVLTVAAEDQTQIEAWLSAADAGQPQPGAAVTLFLNTNPLTPLHATLRTVAYEATIRPDNTLAYRVRATLLSGQQKPRLGLKGTARIDGDRTSLFWWVFRRPLIILRQTVGI